MGKNGHIAKASDPGSATSIDNDVCLRHDADVNCVTRMGGMKRAYCLEVSVDNSQVMDTAQVSGYSRQLLIKKVGWLVNNR